MNREDEKRDVKKTLMKVKESLKTFKGKLFYKEPSVEISKLEKRLEMVRSELKKIDEMIKVYDNSPYNIYDYGYNYTMLYHYNGKSIYQQQEKRILKKIEKYKQMQINK